MPTPPPADRTAWEQTRERFQLRDPTPPTPEPDVTLAAHDVEFVRLGRQEAVVVAVKLLAQRSEKTLVGACTVEQDLTQSVVYATLAAVNRVLGGLRVAEPVEYELRPTSA